MTSLLFLHTDIFHWSMICGKIQESQNQSTEKLFEYLDPCNPPTLPGVFALFGTNTSISRVERVALKNSNNLQSFNFGCTQNHIKGILEHIGLEPLLRL